MALRRLLFEKRSSRSVSTRLYGIGYVSYSFTNPMQRPPFRLRAMKLLPWQINCPLIS